MNLYRLQPSLYNALIHLTHPSDCEFVGTSPGLLQAFNYQILLPTWELEPHEPHELPMALQ